MYSKANFNSHPKIIIPENYRGNAFSEQSNDKEAMVSDERLPTEDLSSENKSSELQEENTSRTHSNSVQSSFLSSIIPPKVSNPTGILNNIGLEEMLIVGILILLFQSDSDDDVLLLLFLLLFYK